jgi:hypothetical protein
LKESLYFGNELIAGEWLAEENQVIDSASSWSEPGRWWIR